MNISHLCTAAVAFGLLACTGLAQAKDQDGTKVTSSPGQGTATRTRTIVATVTELDAAKGHITLKGPDGHSVPLQATPEVRNLDKIKVGDNVKIRYRESLTVSLKKGGAGMRGAAASSDISRAGGGMPGGEASERIEVTADVVAMDPKQQTITLKGANETVDMWVRDPAQFKLVKVGDQVQAVYTQALALSIEPAPARK